MFRFSHRFHNESMKRKTKKLTVQELELLTDRFIPVCFSNAFDLVYEDQVPNTGLVLLEGEANLTRRKKILDQIEPGTVLGIEQLIGNEPVKHGCKIRENAKVILLQKSDLMEILREQDSKLRKVLIS